MKVVRSWPMKLVLVLAVVVNNPVLVGAQQEAPSKNIGDQPENTDTTATTAQNMPTNQAPAVDVPTPGYPIDAQIHPALRAIPWMGTTSPLRWGSFYVGDFSIDQIRDNFRPAGGLASENLNLSIFHTSINFDKTFAKQELVLQYSPQLAVLNGHVASNAGVNNNLMFGTTFQFSPRLSMKLENDLVQVDSRALFPPDILGVDQKTGNLVQNAFLANDGKFFADKVDAVINYQLSPRNLLTVSPGFRYAQDVNHDHLNNPNYLANGDTIGVDVALTHALTSRQNLGVLYKLQVLRATNVPGVSNSVYTYFKTYHLFYANQLSRTWWLRSEIGMENVDYQGFAPNTTEIGVGFGLLRTFTNSVFGISYNRGAMGQNINFITGRIGDRADAYYELQLTRRLKWSNGGGFYRETGAPPRTSGDYGSTKVKYSVLTSVTLVGGYTHIFQDSNTLQLLSGTRDTFDFGLTWAPAGIPRR